MSLESKTRTSPSVQTRLGPLDCSEYLVARVASVVETTDLNEDEATVLALCERGFSPQTISRQLNEPQLLVNRRMDRICAEFGTEALHPVPIDDRDDLDPERPLEQPGPEYVEELNAVGDEGYHRALWFDIVADWPEYAPEWAVQRLPEELARTNEVLERP